MFNIKNKVLINYDGGEKNIVIPEGVVEIGGHAFDNNKNITSVTMPDSVKYIGTSAFEQCIKLRNIILSNNITEIESKAFAGCKVLKEIVLPKTLKTIGGGVFAGCDKLTSIVCESTEIVADRDPFYSDDQTYPIGIADNRGYIIFAKTLFKFIGNTIKFFTVPDGVERIASGVFEFGQFYWLPNYDTEKVVLPESVKYIGSNTFSNFKALKAIEMPPGITIAAGAFKECYGLADENGFFIHDGKAIAYYGNSKIVTVPENTKVIAAKLFASNKTKEKIRIVNLPEGLEEIGDSAFFSCNQLESIVIPNSVKKIGKKAFKGCGHLVNVIMPENIEEMGESAFAGCRGLADESGFIIKNNIIHSYCGTDKDVVIPEGIVSISDNAFCKTSITSIQLPSSLKKLGSAFFGCDCLAEIIIPEGVEEIRRNTFDGCVSLKKVVLSSTVKQIGNKAFSGCRSLVNIHLNEGLLKIGAGAFHNCESITELTIPTTVEEIGDSAFYNCRSLKILNYERIDGNIHRNAFDNCPNLADANGMTIISKELWRYDGPGGDVVIPEGVLSIASGVFSEDYRRIESDNHRRPNPLQSIVFPSTLRRICDNAFERCYSLRNFELPENIEYIGAEAFSGCTSITSIAIPSKLEILKYGIFEFCDQLRQVTLSSAVKTIETKAFKGCKSLTMISITQNVESIEDMAFAGCVALKKFSVDPNNMTFSTFDGMLTNKEGNTLIWVPPGNELTEYEIPPSITTIASHAFIDCKKLKRIVIPATVTTIEEEVFPRDDWEKFCFDEIVVDPRAGATKVGSEVFDFHNLIKDTPIVYPKLPVKFMKEQSVQICLGLGYCLNPDKYEGEYAALYEKYVRTHERILKQKASQMHLEQVKSYFRVKQDENGNEIVGYRPNLSMKKPSELAKVELLEEVIQKGRLEDVIAVLETYKTFEMTARALGFAARYRGVEFVKVLMEHGATFRYKKDPSFQRKYNIYQTVKGGYISTEYYLMVIPNKLHTTAGKWGDYAFSPMCGVPYMNISPDLKPLSLEKRIEVAKFFYENKKLGVLMDEMLYWALTKGNLAFADALIDMGVNLKTSAPSYDSSCMNSTSYFRIITEYIKSDYWYTYIYGMSALQPDQVLPVLERFNKLALSHGKKLLLSQGLFNQVNWNEDAIVFVINNADLSKIDQKSTLEYMIKRRYFTALELLAEAGWLSNKRRRENLISFARDNKFNEALAWLIDFKNRTVDIAAEETAKKAKLLKELNEDPNSVSAMRKLWNYKKLEDGTLQITGYKGTYTEVEIPSQIGKRRVSSIGEEAFCANKWSNKRISNMEVREQITSIVIPEGVTKIEYAAFYGLGALTDVTIPSTLMHIQKDAFKYCRNLKEVSLPAGVTIENGAFASCDGLRNKKGFYNCRWFFD